MVVLMVLLPSYLPQNQNFGGSAPRDAGRLHRGWASGFFAAGRDRCCTNNACHFLLRCRQHRAKRQHVSRLFDFPFDAKSRGSYFCRRSLRRFQGFVSTQIGDGEANSVGSTARYTPATVRLLVSIDFHT